MSISLHRCSMQEGTSITIGAQGRGRNIPQKEGEGGEEEEGDCIGCSHLRPIRCSTRSSRSVGCGIEDRFPTAITRKGPGTCQFQFQVFAICWRFDECYTLGLGSLWALQMAGGSIHCITLGLGFVRRTVTRETPRRRTCPILHRINPTWLGSIQAQFFLILSTCLMGPGCMGIGSSSEAYTVLS